MYVKISEMGVILCLIIEICNMIISMLFYFFLILNLDRNYLY